MIIKNYALQRVRALVTLLAIARDSRQHKIPSKQQHIYTYTDI